MTRFILPFLLALTIHGVISQLSWEEELVQHPKSGGERSIVVEIENLFVPEEQQQIEPRKTEPNPQPKTRPVDAAKKEESSSPPQLPAPKKIQVTSKKQKLVQKRPKDIATPTPNLQTTHTPKGQKQNYESRAVSNAALVPNASKQQPTAIKASPLYQENPKPPYPPLARRRNWQGTVLLLVTVDIQGRSEQVKILKKSGYSILDRAAKKTVQQWEFTPGQINGRPTVMKVQVPIHFMLE